MNKAVLDWWMSTRTAELVTVPNASEMRILGCGRTNNKIAFRSSTCLHLLDEVGRQVCKAQSTSLQQESSNCVLAYICTKAGLTRAVPWVKVRINRRYKMGLSRNVGVKQEKDKTK